MSKIYEALRQAELDRAQNAKQHESGAGASHSSQAVLDPLVPDPFVPEPVSPAGDHASLGSALAASSLSALTPEPLATLKAELGEIPTFPWTPHLHQLPALEERGKAVEQFRSLRSRMYEFRDLNKLKTILVSSGLPQEGKSFIAANLAVSFARHKAGKVLLIDGDMRRATLHKLLGAPGGPGLTEYLAGKSTMEQTMQRPTVSETDPLPHGLATLTFIPGGDEGEKAADLSGNHRFDKLIEAASPFFDWIIVDSSPVNLVSDAVNLARACDAVLLIARSGITKYEAAQRALVEFKASKILGFVLNAVEDPSSTGTYYGYDGYDKPKE